MTDTSERARRKRYQVFSLSESGAPLLVDSFDLPQDAQLCADRIIRNFDHRPKELQIPRPAVHVVDRLNELDGGE